MEIVWSETAIETFFKVVDYWTNKEIESFENKVANSLTK
jgi:hypothetical protein